MNNLCVIPIRVFKKLGYYDFVKVQGVGLRTADFLTNLVSKQKILSENNLKTTIQLHNLQNNNKIRYNFINNNLMILDYKLIYVRF